MLYILGTVIFSLILLGLSLIAIKLQFQFVNQWLISATPSLNSKQKLIRILIMVAFLTGLSVALQGVSFLLPPFLKYF